jgi:hypothetical protein
VHLQDIIIMKKRRIDSRIDQGKVQVQDEELEEVVL